MDDLYSQCYNQICVAENLKMSLQNANKPTYSSPANNQIIIDDYPQSTILRMYYLPTKDLLLAIIKDQKNPLTGAPFSSTTIHRVKNNFSTEIKLIGENSSEYFSRK